jgi:hypothetical protein
MKIEAKSFWRGVALPCETIFTQRTISQTTISQTTISQTTKGDGLNLRPND